MKIQITCGSGFIGAWIIRRFLADGAAIRVFDVKADPALVNRINGDAARDVEWVTGDVSDTGAVREAAAGCDLLIHLAAVLTPACQQDPIRGAQIDLIGTLNVFEAARAYGIGKVLYMSSAGVFGPDDGVYPLPTTHYGAFKLAGEGSARAYWYDHGIASIGFRPLVVYGPGREVGLTAGPTLACRAAAAGDAYTIPFSGESDFVYVDDVAAAFQFAARETIEGARVYNIVGEKCPVTHIVDEIRRIVPAARLDAAGPTLPVSAHIEAGRLREDFPGLPLTSVSTGLQATIDFYRSADG
jgi:nucleoside-diphosphate-sugar epimerase